MFSRRQLRVAESIRQTISQALLRHLRDPRIQRVTVLNVEVSPDLSRAKVSVAIEGDEKKRALAMAGLESARGALQARIAENLQTKHTPVLNFVLDSLDSPAHQAERALELIAAENELKRRQAERATQEPEHEADNDQESAESELQVADNNRPDAL